MAETRKLAAIMAVDVVGYSRLMGEEEAGTARAVKEHRDAARPIVVGLGGRIVKTMGDGLLLEFPSVVAAVECAVAIQKLMVERNADVPELKRVVYRIGVNLGDVLIDGDDILGEGVNIAARLEGICEPGGVLISSTAYDHVRGKIDANFIDLGEKRLKNIARPVHAYRVVMDIAAATSDPSRPEKATAQLMLPDKPSIAVLAFQNMSGDPEQEYFADGMVEDIITGLSRIKWLFVIARNSSFVYKGKAVDVRQIGRELGVRYVLEGGVRRSGKRLRITTQLIEAETAVHLWADRFDGAIEDVFDLQDQITERVVGMVEPSLQRSEIERSRRKRPDNLDAYDLYLRAFPHVMKLTPEQVRVGADFLNRALMLDPNYPAAHALLSLCHEICYGQDGFDEVEKGAGLLHARAALSSGTDDATALSVAAMTIAHLGKDYYAAASAIERALSFNASSTTALYFGAHINSFRGNCAVATEYAARALRLSPFDPWAYEGHVAFAMAAIQASRYDEAASHFAKAVQANPSFTSPRFLLAMTLANAGRIEEARQASEEALELQRTFRSRLLLEIGLSQSFADYFIAGARLLGLSD